MSAHFSQNTFDATGSSLQKTTGEISVKRPGLFRWHTDEPQEQLLISNGKKIWLYDPDLEQVTIQKLDQRLSHTPALLLSGDISKISKNFTITQDKAGQVDIFSLRPHSKDGLFDVLRLSFQGNKIQEMKLIDSTGQVTQILFNQLKTNIAIDSKAFTFKIPAGTDVIKE
ncbi:UNVERIFIED_CONTAM: hypothetical protein GTU68_024141 [Idotea baltica]|nr:hypothetical protein [Idotea baltica]